MHVSSISRFDNRFGTDWGVSERDDFPVQKKFIVLLITQWLKKLHGMYIHGDPFLYDNINKQY